MFVLGVGAKGCRQRRVRCISEADITAIDDGVAGVGRKPPVAAGCFRPKAALQEGQPNGQKWLLQSSPGYSPILSSQLLGIIHCYGAGL